MATQPGEMIFQRAYLSVVGLSVSGLGTFNAYVYGGWVNDESAGQDADVKSGRANLQMGDQFFQDTSIDDAVFQTVAVDIADLTFKNGRYGNPFTGYKPAHLEIRIDDSTNTFSLKVRDAATGAVLKETVSPISVAATRIRVDQLFAPSATPVP
jgi:hypothetical protein